LRIECDYPPIMGKVERKDGLSVTPFLY
jgi:hypothetical protein